MYIRRYFFFNNDGIPFKAYTDLVGRRIVISTVLFSIANKGNSREVTKDTKEIIWGILNRKEYINAIPQVASVNWMGGPTVCIGVDILPLLSTITRSYRVIIVISASRSAAPQCYLPMSLNWWIPAINDQKWSLYSGDTLGTKVSVPWIEVSPNGGWGWGLGSHYFKQLDNVKKIMINLSLQGFVLNYSSCD